MTKWARSWASVLSTAMLIAFFSPALAQTASAPAIEATRTNPDQLKKVRVNGVELHYLERGRGTPIIFVHGGLDDYRYWKAQIEPFSGRYRVIAYSRRYNYPNNNPIIRPDHSAIVEADDLAALIQSLKLGRVHVVGASYGAYTALCLALKHPEMVRTLVLAEPPVLRWLQDKPQGAALYEEFMNRLWKPAGEAFKRGDNEQALRITIEYFLGKGGFEQIPEDVRQGWRENLGEWQALTASTDAFPDLRRAEIKRIRAPVLMLSGEQTLPIQRLVDEDLRPLLRDSDRVIIAKATHDMWIDQPEACKQTTLAFLARH